MRVGGLMLWVNFIMSMDKRTLIDEYQWNLLRIGWLLILLLGGEMMMSGQTQLTGTVMDRNGKGISQANVIIKKHTRIITFTVTDEEGRFKLNMPGSLDSLKFSINHLSYDVLEWPLETGKVHYNLVLQTRTQDLPEIVVKIPPVVRKGDTLVFNVRDYVRQGDETIEQVLTSLPGVNVLPDGRITYQGLDINKFYVEGLDLLEGRYNLITRNLGLQHIRDIEIIERHQPIRALDSISRPENAAINLRLKSNLALTGSAQGELALPLSGMAATHWFGFTKNQQFHVSGSFNNLGERFTADYVSHYTIINPTYDPEIMDLKKPYLPQQLPYRSVARTNKEFTLGGDLLKKLSEFTQLKVQAYGLSDLLKQRGDYVSNYFLGGSSSQFVEGRVFSSEPGEWSGRSILEFNSPKSYSLVHTEITSKHQQSVANNLVNEQLTREALVKNTLEVKNKLSMIINRKNKKALAIQAHVNYQDQDYHLDMLDAFILIPNQGSTFFPQLEQVAHTQTLDAKLISGFHFKKNKFSSTTEFTPQLIHRRITSRALQGGQLIDDNFYNQYLSRRESLRLNQSFNYTLEKLWWALDWPVSLDFITAEDKSGLSRYKNEYLNYQPVLSMGWELKKENFISVQAGYVQNIFTYGDLYYDGYIIESSRHVKSQSAVPNEIRGINYGLNLRGIRPEKNFHYFTHVTYQQQSSQLLNNNLFDPNGISSAVWKQKNQSNSVLVTGAIELSPLPIAQVKINGSFNYTRSDQVINGISTNFLSTSVRLEPEFGLTYDRHALTVGGLWEHLAIRTIRMANDQLRLSFNHYWQLNSKLGMDVKYLIFNLGKEAEIAHLLNLEWRYSWIKRKTKIFLRLVNVLDARQITSFAQATYYNTWSTYRLEPRRVQLGFKKEF